MMQDPIQLLRDDPLDDRRLAEVRLRVLERLRARRPGPGRWILAGAVACAMLLTAAIGLRPEAIQSPALAWSPPAPPSWALRHAPRVEPPDRRLAPAARPQAGERRAQQPDIEIVEIREAAEPDGPETALLEIPTLNPDVVLYWLVDEGGD